MTEDENKLLKELIKTWEETGKRFTRVMALVTIVLSIMIGCMLGMSISYNNTLKECTRLYFETDYDYGTVTQTQEVQVGE